MARHFGTKLGTPKPVIFARSTQRPIIPDRRAAIGDQQILYVPLSAASSPVSIASHVDPGLIAQPPSSRVTIP
jgi:hypothetical protein